jgi:hypothetical protein
LSEAAGDAKLFLVDGHIKLETDLYEVDFILNALKTGEADSL